MNIETTRSTTFAIVAACALLAGCSTMGTGSGTGEKAFQTPEAAVAALAEVAATGDQKTTDELFGVNSFDVIGSGDAVADRQRALEVKGLIDEKVAFENSGSRTKIAVLGNEAWPFPIPLVKTSGGWRFDTAAGREELENRRIGRNELDTLATLHAIVDAQREYRSMHHDGRSGVYASRVISSKGKRDGLYWPTADGKPASPLGPLVAEATTEGYSTDNASPSPYHGYYYRIVRAQGANAPGGAKSYLDASGAMTKGFAVVAWPAKYGNSGRMTFVVDQQGIVFQKDLGERTDTTAAVIAAFDPDETWAPTGD